MFAKCFRTLLACGLTLTAIAISANASAETLRVGSTANDVPFTFLNPASSKVEGFLCDVIAEVAKEAGFTIDDQMMPFSSLIPSLTSNRIDIISAAMFTSAERAKVLDFTNPVYGYGETLFVAESDHTAYEQFSDLKGAIVGAQVGTLYVKGLQESNQFSEIKTYDSLQDVISDVNAGRIKAGFGDYPIAAYFLAQGKFKGTRIVTTYKPTMSGSISLGVRKGQPELLARLNKAIATIQASGRMDAIKKKWNL
jgi:polar amino acid transport system substrate-binding protein